MKRILITGANKGIGLATAAALLDRHDDVHVLVGSRDRGRGEQALRSLCARQPAWEQRLELLVIDVGDDASVAAAAAQIASRWGTEPAPLYGLVNNAGIGFADHSMEQVLQVNVHGPWRVFNAMLPLLNANGGRVVNVTSASGPMYVSKCSPARQRALTSPDVTWASIVELMDECLAVTGGSAEFAAKGLGDGSSYGISKACANACTIHMARTHPNLLVNACTPGFIETDMTRPMAVANGKTPEQMGMKPPVQGTVSIMFLLFGEPQGSGHYYGSDGLRSPLDRYRAPGDPPYTGQS